MGESKRRKQKLLARNPFCCFCGGTLPATTIDHVPAKVMFWGNRRPEGLEFPACIACNGGTKKLERAAALFSRVQLKDSRTQEQRAEHRALAQGVRTDFPGWFHEMQTAPEDTREFQDTMGPTASAGAKPINVGPLIQDAVYAVGAKLAFALHFCHTGKIIPSGGLVSVRYETNFSLQSRELPGSLLAELGPQHMLAQGKWTSEGHFAYRGNWVQDGSGSVFICHLGEALLWVLFAAVEERLVPESEAMRHFRPGDLQRADAIARARYNTALPIYKMSAALEGSLG